MRCWKDLPRLHRRLISRDVLDGYRRKSHTHNISQNIQLAEGIDTTTAQYIENLAWRIQFEAPDFDALFRQYANFAPDAQDQHIVVFERLAPTATPRGLSQAFHYFGAAVAAGVFHDTERITAWVFFCSTASAADAREWRLAHHPALRVIIPDIAPMLASLIHFTGPYPDLAHVQRLFPPGFRREDALILSIDMPVVLQLRAPQPAAPEQQEEPGDVSMTESFPDIEPLAGSPSPTSPAPGVVNATEINDLNARAAEALPEAPPPPAQATSHSVEVSDPAPRAEEVLPELPPPPAGCAPATVTAAPAGSASSQVERPPVTFSAEEQCSRCRSRMTEINTKAKCGLCDTQFCSRKCAAHHGCLVFRLRNFADDSEAERRHRIKQSIEMVEPSIAQHWPVG